MSDRFNDINNDEIRIINSDKLDSPWKKEDMDETALKPNQSDKNNVVKRRSWLIWVLIFILVIVIGVCCIQFMTTEEDENYVLDFQKEFVEETPSDVIEPESQTVAKGFTEIFDTTVNKVALTIIKPRNLTPVLRLGPEALEDSDAVFVVQAADIRRDNGGIVGAYVYEGNLLSRGRSKSGFCAIINGKLTVGVADATPYLEQAIENEGYFFRQFPLVVGGQVVDNKLKYSSLRKALAEIDGETAVVMSHKAMTLNEFSQTLADLGVTNAIYLIGSTAYGFAKDKTGNRFEFGKKVSAPHANTNYIVWK